VLLYKKHLCFQMKAMPTGTGSNTNRQQLPRWCLWRVCRDFSHGEGAQAWASSSRTVLLYWESATLSHAGALERWLVLKNALDVHGKALPTGNGSSTNWWVATSPTLQKDFLWTLWGMSDTKMPCRISQLSLCWGSYTDCSQMTSAGWLFNWSRGGFWSSAPASQARWLSSTLYHRGRRSWLWKWQAKLYKLALVFVLRPGGWVFTPGHWVI
jgi:hypothetical protein